MAARRTDRLIDHATKARQASTDSPMNPRAAPTAINTVPSGRFDCRMYGAFSVGGTVATGIEYVKLVELVVELNVGRVFVELVLVVRGGKLSVSVDSGGRLSVDVASVVWAAVWPVVAAAVSVAVVAPLVVVAAFAVSVVSAAVVAAWATT